MIITQKEESKEIKAELLRKKSPRYWMDDRCAIGTGGGCSDCSTGPDFVRVLWNNLEPNEDVRMSCKCYTARRKVRSMSKKSV